MTMECMSDVRDGDGAGGDDMPVTLYAGDVAQMFRAADGEEYKKARKEFIRCTTIDFRALADSCFAGYLRSLFEEWFAYDRQLRDVDATPFDLVARFLRESGELSEAEYEDCRSFGESTFCSWFWIRDASASSRCMTLEDLATGVEYRVQSGECAARFDGASGGSVIVRIAKARGQWRLTADPIVTMREPRDDEGHDMLASLVREWQPDLLDLVEMAFARHPSVIGAADGRCGCADARPRSLRRRKASGKSGRARSKGKGK